MLLKTAERIARAAGGVGILITFVAVYSGLMGGLRHRKGRATDDAPAIARAFAKGSLPLYGAMTVFGLAALRWMWRPVGIVLSPPLRWASLIAGSLLYFPGLALIVWGRVTMGSMHNVSTSAAVQLYADHRLVTSGPFARVRHPMYVGGIMAELGALLLYRTWTTLAIALNIPNLALRARREEEALSAEFGEAWVEYSRRVPAWLPRVSP